MDKQEIKGRDSMSGVVVIFLGSVLFVALGLYFWDKREGEAYDNTWVEMKKVMSKVNALENDLTAKQKELYLTIKDFNEAKNRIQGLEDANAKLREELDVFRDQVADTQEKQIKIREALAAKRPMTKVVLPTGPIQVEVWSRPVQQTKPPTQPSAQPPPQQQPAKKGPLGKGVKSLLRDEQNGK